MSWSRRYEEAEPQRVNRWLAQSGVCSRREAEALIAEGRVLIDGERVIDAGRKIAPGQTLMLEGRGDGEGSAPPTYVLNKPAGYVSAQPEPGQTPAARLLSAANLWAERSPPPDVRASLAPLGRLDRDSRGLLLLSSDGVLAKAVIGPDSRLDKAYRVCVSGDIGPNALARLRHGLHLDGRALKLAQVDRVGPQTLDFVLQEGRNRQIRRMCELVGLRVEDLLRLRIGPLALGDLPQGRWRPLTSDERSLLIQRSK